jgi:hypothetical protein
MKFIDIFIISSELHFIFWLILISILNARKHPRVMGLAHVLDWNG